MPIQHLFKSNISSRSKIMPIPSCDDRGFLSEGVYESTLDEIIQRFGQFQSSDWRIILGQRLRTYVAALSSTGLAEELYVDGSFVSTRERPSDIDLIVGLKSNHDFKAELVPFDAAQISSKAVKARYRFDMLVARCGDSTLSRYVDFFQDVKGMPGQRKGILRIPL